MAAGPDPDDTRAAAPIHFLHIRKTGGTAIKAALKPVAAKHGLVLHNHDFTLADAPDAHGIVFFLRDPVSRFVSGFNCRLRKGQPRWNVEWNAIERKTFARFKSPNELAEALSSDDKRSRERARRAMNGMLHVREPLTKWFPSTDVVRDRMASIVWIGLQETLEEDLEELKRRLGLPAYVALPAEDSRAHRAPDGHSTALSELGRQNIEEWYDDDMRLYDQLREMRTRLADADYVRPQLSAGQRQWAPVSKSRRKAPTSPPTKPFKVFGIGFHKTGTKSLSLALRKLGYTVRSAIGIKDKEIAANAWEKVRPLIDQYDAFEDNPWPILYRELYAHRPDSKFILTMRPAQSWIGSVVAHFGSETTPMREWIYGVGSPAGNEALYVERYERHLREVTEFFADKPGSLLAMDFAAGDGWEKLCAFLGEPIPRDRFPHKHSKEDRMKHRGSVPVAPPTKEAMLLMG